ncbi:LysR family transcriptional regulator [Roseospira marina]|uniref:LysR family transcriptional regulator n=1 Tax=Roseospira marina TaxID=140057 RepID=A0A5M6IG19_9PROT|nr:LysR substrate-binding domain-containing protein [Roseospira marina]KAA5606528.1 LysR family transcriptional regulator [Roseospira marina]MBB4314044.1 LysR family hydrogen peroxide-inducible transcriptional activator [Roseospira marina]MBB5087205.1 LysR family hydrogen peroxide-inducible transcriptional activator [Roseospira marina]
MRALPTPRQLLYLVTVAETLHFGRAAERCHVTQSTLSAGLRELETLLGVTLVERQTRRRVILTPVGQEVVARAQRLLADAEALVDTAAARAAPLSGLLRLGVIPTIGPYLLPGVLPGLRRTYPDLRLYLREDLTDALLSALAAGVLDVALVAMPFDLRGMVSVPIGAEDIVVALPADHALAAQKTLREADLTDQPLLMLEDGHCLRDHALTACHMSRARANEAFQATSLTMLTQMVAAGLGLTLLPRMAVDREITPGGGVVTRDLTGAGTARTLVLAWRPGAARDADYRLLADALRASLDGTPAPAC